MTTSIHLQVYLGASGKPYKSRVSEKGVPREWIDFEDSRMMAKLRRHETSIANNPKNVKGNICSMQGANDLPIFAH